MSSLVRAPGLLSPLVAWAGLCAVRLKMYITIISALVDSFSDFNRHNNGKMVRTKTESESR